MAENRYIKTAFWDDEYIAGLTWMETYLFLYFLTNPKTNVCGVYQILMKHIVIDTKLDQSDVSAILEKFERDGKMMYRNGWIALRNWIKNQKTGSKDLDKGITRHLSSAPEWAKMYISGKNPDSVPPTPVPAQWIFPLPDEPEAELSREDEWITAVLEMIRQNTGIVSWVESRKSERAQGGNFKRLLSEIGEDEFLKRLRKVVQEMNSASFAWLYGKMVAYVDQVATKRKKKAIAEDTDRAIEEQAKKREEAARGILQEKYDSLPEEERASIRESARASITKLVREDSVGFGKILDGAILGIVREKYKIAL